jgi:hypothetical protein
LVGYLIAYAIRWLKRWRFWRRVEASAKAALEDERVPITDPQEATEHALIEAQKLPVARVVRAVRASAPPTTTPHPRNGSQSDVDRDPGKSG